jgi:hypothetical protein
VKPSNFANMSVGDIVWFFESGRGKLADRDGALAPSVRVGLGCMSLLLIFLACPSCVI